MRLFKILESTQSSSPSDPCVIYQHTVTSASSSSSPLPPKASCLTYAGAYRACQLHKDYLHRAIRGQCGVGYQKGEGEEGVVIAFLANNTADFLLATLACTEINNAIPVLLNTRWTPSEMVEALKSKNRNDNTILIHDNGANNTNRAEQVATMLRENHTRVSTLVLPSISIKFEKAIDKDEAIIIKKSFPSREHTECDDDSETALILFTSGTTSGAKGVLLSHRALGIQARAKLNTPCGYDAQTKMLATTVPLFHVGGLSSALAVWMAGGALVFPPPPPQQQQQQSEQAMTSFQPQAVLLSLQRGPKFSSNTLVVVPAMLSSLMNTNSTEGKTYPGVRLVLIGGQSASSKLLHQVHKAFPNARIIQTYACTEAASSLTFWQRHPSTTFDSNFPGDQPDDALLPDDTGAIGTCIGRPPEHVELRLFRTTMANGTKHITEIIEPFTSGVLATRGPHVLEGYWRRGEGSNNTTITNYSIDSFQSPLTSDGWFLSNDLGYQDRRGRFYFSGRVADVIRTGGETVLATEVERILLQHKEISECAVFALPDDKFGETVCAAIVPQIREDHGNTTTTTAKKHIDQTSLIHHHGHLLLNNHHVRKWCAEKGLAGYKRPRRLFLVEALPRNSSGKVLKRLLVKQFSSSSSSGMHLRSKL